MNVTIKVSTQSGADVEISQDRHEVTRMADARDFDRRLIAETLDAVVERVRASYGIGDYAPDPSPDLADGRAVSDMADNEDRDHDEGRP